MKKIILIVLILQSFVFSNSYQLTQNDTDKFLKSEEAKRNVKEMINYVNEFSLLNQKKTFTDLIIEEKRLYKEIDNTESRFKIYLYYFEKRKHDVGFLNSIGKLEIKYTTLFRKLSIIKLSKLVKKSKY